ncbi:uncharacterized protein F4807DRAFT_456477 [Annulohypoxylon truncatum]|uniref:uncharacterized protein n=1 Tax=Annulohypoxylon truncatum TaxID=327061 RepID=UPI00200866DB|nr:uncharacterized protein F4807DRAFT_456477 [Annulohypoxylon truncatum]KAI1213932.1 hypothetical protein F4807DRAFT_456477 [Annulohypoxylon truncatum]
MGLLRPFNFLLLGLLVPLGQVACAPTAEGEPTILSRDYTGYTECSDDQRNHINRAFQDAAVIARQVTQNRGPQTFRSSLAFTHYFRDDQYDSVQKMLAAIGEQWQPPAPDSHQSGAGPQIQLNQFTVKITCQYDDVCISRGKKSLVVTDVGPESSSFTPQMRFCPQFFREPATSRNLDSEPYKLKPKRYEESWCKPGYKFLNFEVGGTTIVHELTHLDEAGIRAGFTRRPVEGQPFSSAGTEDIYEASGYTDNPPTAARQLHDNWVKALRKNPPKDPPPYPETLNAESYAASVTEWWFMTKCELDDIEL